MSYIHQVTGPISSMMVVSMMTKMMMGLAPGGTFMAKTRSKSDDAVVKNWDCKKQNQHLICVNDQATVIDVHENDYKVGGVALKCLACDKVLHAFGDWE